MELFDIFANERLVPSVPAKLPITTSSVQELRRVQATRFIASTGIRTAAFKDFIYRWFAKREDTPSWKYIEFAHRVYSGKIPDPDDLIEIVDEAERAEQARREEKNRADAEARRLRVERYRRETEVKRVIYNQKRADYLAKLYGNEPWYIERQERLAKEAKDAYDASWIGEIVSEVAQKAEESGKQQRAEQQEWSLFRTFAQNVEELFLPQGQEIENSSASGQKQDTEETGTEPVVSDYVSNRTRSRRNQRK